MGEERQGPACRTVCLVDRLLDELGIVGHAGEIDAVCGKFNRPQFDMGFLEEAIGA